MQVGKSGSIYQLLIIETEIFFFCFALFFFIRGHEWKSCHCNLR